MLPILVIADGVEADPRLKVAFTASERYLPLSELAARLTKATNEPIAVDGGMSSRKLVLCVDGRPAAETMGRVADALAGRWTREGSGWRLGPDPDYEREERRATASRGPALRIALGEWAARAAVTVQDPKDSPRAKVALLLRDLGPRKATDDLLAGKLLVGTSDGRAGTRIVNMADAFQRSPLRTPDGGDVFPSEGMILLRWDAETGRVITTLRSLGERASTGSFGWTDLLRESRPTPNPLDQLDESWAVESEKTVGETRLKTLSPDPDPYRSGLASLADVLARLHARTGLPVAAESFRAPVAAWGDPSGETVAASIRAVLDAPIIKLGRAPSFVWKGAGGWILARPSEAWSQRRGEIPESRLVLLERKRMPDLEDYAALVGSLSEPQRAALEYFRPLATFPTITLRSGFWGLLIYDALPPTLRRQATSGLAFDEMPPLARERWRRAVVDSVCRRMVPEEWVNAAVANRLPPGAGFRLAEGRHYVNRGDIAPLGGRAATDLAPYRSFLFHLGGTNPIAIHAPISPLAP